MSFEKQAKAIESRAFELTTQRTGGLTIDALGLIEAVLEHVHQAALLAVGAPSADHLVPSCDPGRWRTASAAHACPHGVCGGKCCPLPPADAVDEAARSMLQVQEVFPGAQPQALAWQDMGNGDWMLWGLPLSISAAVYAPDEEQPEHSYEVGQREEVLAQGLAPSVEEARLQCMRAAARVLARMVQEAEQAAMALSRGCCDGDGAADPAVARVHPGARCPGDRRPADGGAVMVGWEEKADGLWALTGLRFGMTAVLFRDPASGLLTIVVRDADEELVRNTVDNIEEGRQRLLRAVEVALESLVMSAEQALRELRAAAGPGRPRPITSTVAIRGGDWLIERWPDRTLLRDEEMDERWEVPGNLTNEQVLAVEQLREMARATGDLCGRANLRAEVRQLLGAAEAVR